MERTMYLEQHKNNSFLLNCFGILFFAILGLFFAQKLYFFKAKQSEGFVQYDNLYNSTTLGSIESVEYINEIEKRVTYTYQVSNYRYKNVQTLNHNVSIEPQDKVQISFDGFDSFDSCIIAKLPTFQSICFWLLLLFCFTSTIIAFFHFAIKIYDF